MFDPAIANHKDAVEALGKILDKIPKNKIGPLVMEIGCVEITLNAMAKLLNAIRQWHIDTYGEKDANKAAFVIEIDKLVARKK